MPTLASQQSTIRTAIEGYLALLDGISKTESRDLKKLTLALDALVAAYQLTDEIDANDLPDDEIEAPQATYRYFYERASAAFPTLGHYEVVANSEIGMADAIDDLSDIAIDLMETIWHLDHLRSADAIWNFRFGYQTHWGVHLHSLRSYLHSSNVAAW